MNLRQAWRTRWFLGLGVVFAVALLLLAVELLNGRFTMADFDVYYLAGRRALAGENLYRPVEDGFYNWRYGPASAYLFSPFTALPLFAAKVLYWPILAAVVTANLFLAVRLADPGFREHPARTNRVVLLTALALAVHLHIEIHLGQVNQVLLLLFLLMATAFIARRPVAFGCAFAWGLALKPFGLAFLPYLVLKRRWRELLASAGATAALALLPLATYRPQALAEQYGGWWYMITWELGRKMDPLAAKNHTAASVLARYTPLRLLPLGDPAVQRALVLGTTLALGLLVLWFLWRGRALARPEPAEFALLVLVGPMIAFPSAYNAYGAALPAAALLLSCWDALGRGWRIATAAALVLLGGNVHDLWGKRIFGLLNDASLVAVGAVVLVCCLARERALAAPAFDLPRAAAE